MNRQPLELMIRYLESHENTGSLEEDAIRLVLRMQLELDERLTQLEREMARGPDTEPAPPRELCSLPGESNPAGDYAESWSGAEVVPRGSSRPPASYLYRKAQGTERSECLDESAPLKLCSPCAERREHAQRSGLPGFTLCDQCSRDNRCTVGSAEWPAVGPDMTEGGDEK